MTTGKLPNVLSHRNDDPQNPTKSKTLPKRPKELNDLETLYNEVHKARIKDIFLIFKGEQREVIKSEQREETIISEQWEAVKKNSLQGRILAMRAGIAKIFGTESKLSRSKQLLLQKIKKVKNSGNDFFGQQHVKEFFEHIEPEHERRERTVEKVAATVFDYKKYQEEAERIKRVQKYSPRDPTSAKTEKVAIPKFETMSARRAFIEKKLIDQQPTIGSNLKLEPLLDYLLTYSGTDEFLIASMEVEADDDKIKEILLKAVTSALAGTLKKEDRVIFDEMFKNLSPQKSHETLPGLEIKELALVLGDSFIEGSDLEGAWSSNSFIQLAIAFLKERVQVTDGTETTGSIKLRSELEHVVDLNNATLATASKDIQDQITRDGRCLMLGGWTEHAILYEIEENKETGLFTLRVFNQGIGVKYHAHLLDDYKSKYASAKGYTGIQFDDLFGVQVLGELIYITRCKNGDDVLYNGLFNVLQRKGCLEEQQQHYVAPQRSGTCTFRSFQSFLATALQEEEYKQFKFEFKLFLLSKYYNKTVDRSYEESLLEYQVLSRIIGKYASEIANERSKDPPVNSLEKIEEAHALLTKFQARVLSLEESIFEYEKKEGLNVAKLTSEKPEKSLILAPTYNPPSFDLLAKSYNIPPSTFKRYDVFQSIEAIPSSADSTYATAIENCLRLLSDPSLENRMILFDHFFKKIATVHNYPNITFQNPNQVIIDLSQMIKILTQEESHTDATRCLMIAAALYLSETAFRQLPEQERVLRIDFPSFIGLIDLSSLTLALYPDPFWAQMYTEIQQLQQQYKFSYQLPNLDGKYTLPDHMQIDLVNWWNNRESAFLDKVHASVQADRVAQERRIKEWEQQVQLEIDALSAEIDDHQKEIKQNEILLTAKQSELNPKITDLKQQSEQLIRERGDIENKRRGIAVKLESLNNDLSTQYEEDEALKKKLEGLKAEDRQTTWEIQKQRDLARSREQLYEDISSWNLKLTNVNQELNKLDVKIARINEQKKAHENEITTIQENIHNLKVIKNQLENKRYERIATFSQIPTMVQNDPQYWPWGWETENDLSRTFRAAFIFGNQQNEFLQKKGFTDWRPPQFMDFLNSAIVARYAASESAKNIVTPLAIVCERDKGKITLSTPRVSSLIQPDKTSWDRNQVATVLKSDWLKVYKELVIPRPEDHETHVPSITHTLFGDQSTIGKVSRDEFSELLSFRQRENQIDSVLSYFQENSDKLSDPNWVLIFYAYLFESDILLESIRAQPQLVFRLNDFFDKMENDAMQLKNYALAGHLVWIRSHVHRHVEFVSKEQNKNLGIVFSAKSLTRVFSAACDARTNIPAGADDPFPSFLESLAAASSNLNLERTAPDDVGIVCLIKTLSGRFPVAEKRIELRTKDLERVERSIQRYFTNPQNGLKSCISESFNHFFKKFYFEIGDFPEVSGESHVSTKGVHLSLSTCRLAAAEGLEEYKDSLSSDQRALLIKHGFYDEKNFPELRCQNIGDRVLIIDEANDRKLAIQHGKIYAKIVVKASKSLGDTAESEWLEFIPLIKRDYLQFNGLLAERYFHFGGKDGIYLVNREGHVKYEIAGQSLKERSNGLQLSNLLQLKETPFTLFEDSKSVNVWVDDKNELRKIDFQRLGLSFDKKDGKFCLSSDPAWFISEQQFAPHLGPKTGFITLENGHGEKRVIVPIWDPINPITYDPKVKTTFKFPYQFKFDPKKEAVPFALYELSGRKLIPKNLESRFHLASIYMEKGYMNLAEELLFSNEALLTSRSLSENEKNILERIVYRSASKENTGAKARLQLHALYILQNNHAIYIPEKSPYVLQNMLIEKIIKTYLNRLGHTRPLDKNEELFLLELFIDPIYVRSDLNKRYQELDGRYEELEKISPTPKTTARRIETPPKVEIPAAIDRKKFYDYRAARNKNSFPFDPKNVVELEKGIFDYEQFILRECEKFPTLSRSRQKSLIEMLTHARIVFAEWVEKKSKINEFLEKIEVVTAETDYYRARAKNEFPFDQTNQDSWLLGLSMYRHFIEKECSQFSSLEPDAQKSLMELINRYLDTKGIPSKEVSMLIDLINKSKERQKSPNQVDVPALTTPRRKRIPLVEAVKKESQNLSPFKLIQAPYTGFLVEGGKNVVRPVAADSIPEQTLFDENSPEITTPAQSKQFEKMREDMKVAHAKLQVLRRLEYNSDTKATEEFEEELDVQITANQNELAKLEDYILNGLISALTFDPVSAIQFASKKRSLPTFKEICVLCARMDSDATLKKLYPELTKEGIENLKESIKTYLIQKSYLQLLERTQQKISAISKTTDPESAKIMRIELGNSFKGEIAYQPNDSLAMVFLTIETISNIKLRPEQVESVRQLYVAQQKGDKGLVLQMIMGGGKTSVIQPLLAFLFAEPGKLSTVTLPRSLFEKVSDELVKLLGSSFDQFVFKDPMTVQHAKDRIYLKNYYERLKFAKDVGALVMMTPQDKYIIDASLKEAYENLRQMPNNFDLSHRCNLLANISKFFEIHEVAQIDEIDMVLNPTIVYRIPVGDQSVIDADRADLVTRMLLELTTDEEFSSSISLDFIDNFNARSGRLSQGKALTEASFETEVVPKLVEIAYLLFCEEIKLKDDEDQKNLRSFLLQRTPADDEIAKANITPAQVEQIMEDIDANKHNPDDTIVKLVLNKRKEILERNRELKETFNTEQLQFLGDLTRSIHVILKKSLFKECSTNYSFAPEDIAHGRFTARPFSAPNDPKKSVPSDPFEMLILSVQNLIYHGIPRNGVEKAFLAMQKSAEDHAQRGENLLETEGYKEFERIMGNDATGFTDKPPNPEMIRILQQKMNCDKKALHDFMKDFMFKQIRFYPKSLSTTPQALTGMSRQSCGYTGTINTGILPTKMEGKPDIGTDGKTITVVNQKITAGTSTIREYKPSEKQTYPQLAIEFFKKEKDVFVMGDSGNWLKQENLQEWVKVLLTEVSKERSDIEGVVFPDLEGKWLCCQKKGDLMVIVPYDDSALKSQPLKRLTIIPSKHETGTDIKQAPTAKSFLTIRKSMTARDSLQSLFRMRQILEGQNLIFAVSQETKDHMVTLMVQSLFEKEPWASIPSKSSDEFQKAIAEITPRNALEMFFKETLLKLSLERWSQNPKENLGEIISHISKSFEISQHADSLWNYFFKNQIMEQTANNEIAIDQKMAEVFEKPIRMVLNDSTLPLEDRLALFAALDSYFVPSRSDNPFEAMSTRRALGKPEKAIQAKANDYLNKFKSLKGLALFQKIETNVKLLYGDKAGSSLSLQNALLACAKDSNGEDILLPELMTMKQEDMGGGDIEMDVEQEAEQEAEVEEEAEIEQEVEAMIPSGELKKIDYKPIGRLQDIFDQREPYKVFHELQTLLPKDAPLVSFVSRSGLLFSANVFPDNRISSPYNLPGRYMLVRGQFIDGQIKYSTSLVSHEDASNIKKEMKKGQLRENESMFLVPLDGKMVISKPQEAQLDLNEIKENLVIAKLISGKLPSRDDVEVLRLMINKESQPKKTAKDLEELFLDIIKWKPKTAERYKHNPLRNLFKEMKK